jgi:polyketide cyclase/dehydrase/lipid transport protein
MASTSSRIMIAAPRAGVMAVIADFAAYPQWASAVRAAETLGQEAGGRARRVRFSLDAGIVKDSYVLGYDWNGDAGVRWQLAEPGSVISGMSGGYALAERAGETEVTYELAVDVRVPMPGLLKRRAEKTIIDTALKGLKNRAERLCGESGSSGSARREPGDTGGDGR